MCARALFFLSISGILAYHARIVYNKMDPVRRAGFFGRRLQGQLRNEV